MGLWTWVANVIGLLPPPENRHTFDTAPKPIDEMFVEMRGRGSTVTREQAMSVTTVQRGRNLLCSIATLPLEQLAPDNTRVRNPLLDQIDPDVANVVTMAQTLEDLIFDAIAWWKVTARDAAGFPVYAQRLDPNTVSLDPPVGRSPAPLPSGEDPRRPGVVYVDGKAVPWNDVIRFDSPNAPLLRAGANAIRRSLRLANAADVYASDPRPGDYFTSRDGLEPESDDVLDEFLADWRQARKDRATGYVPYQYEYNTVDAPSPADLQLAELQRQVGLELANAMGIDPEELGISTTSRTYANVVDRRRDKINDVLSMYMRAITDRLSMGDVTRRGYRVLFNLDDYLKSNPTERWTVYNIARGMGALTVPEIREAEKWAPLPEDTDGEPVTEPTPLRPVPDAEDTDGLSAFLHPITSFWPQVHNFEAPNSHQFTLAPGAEDGFTFAVDSDKRTITGLAVPWNKIGMKYGMKFRFKPGSLAFSEVSRVKHFKDHAVPVGRALELKNTRAGMMARLSVGQGPTGDELLQLAADEIYDGLSVGVEFSLNPDDGDVVLARDGVYDVLRADLREITTTAMPAYDDARVTRVAASRDGGTTMSCQTCGTDHAPGVACAQQTQGAIFAQQAPGGQGQGATQQGAPAPPQAGAPAPPAPRTEAAGWNPEQIGIAMAAEPTGMGLTHAVMGFNTPMAQRVIAAVAAASGPQVVNPTRPTANTTVREPDPYRFDRKGNLVAGSHDFSTDLFAGYHGDIAAMDRATAFTQHAFDVATGDVNELNPTRQRPDLYVDQRDFRYPVWDAINKGTLADITPFTFPKFNSASGLVGNHTEGSEPSSGTLTTTGQTVTPTAVSGKAKITREVWDQGGNPQVSGLIWRQMQKGWFEALEAFAVATLDAATPTAIALTAGAVDAALDDELTNAFVLLQYVRGGFTMDNLFTQVDLYKALANARDGDERRLYPALGPTNASGTARGRWAALDLNGVVANPAWALAASGAVVASSYLFDSESVHGWASTPQRLDFNIEVAHVYIGLWGYKAAAISDIAGVREVTYDPVA
jgi:phage head maturation protease